LNFPSWKPGEAERLLAGEPWRAGAWEHTSPGNHGVLWPWTPACSLPPKSLMGWRAHLPPHQVLRPKLHLL